MLLCTLFMVSAGIHLKNSGARHKSLRFQSFTTLPSPPTSPSLQTPYRRPTSHRIRAVLFSTWPHHTVRERCCPVGNQSCGKFRSSPLRIIAVPCHPAQRTRRPGTALSSEHSQTPQCPRKPSAQCLRVSEWLHSAHRFCQPVQGAFRKSCRQLYTSVRPFPFKKCTS